MSTTDSAARSDSGPAVASPVLAMWALFLGVALMMIGNGLQTTLLGVRSSLEGFDTVAIGVIQAMYFAGFLIGSRFTLRALPRVGHIRVFSALASIASTATLMYVVFVSPATWFATRFVTGFCMAGLYVVAESWLNDKSTPEKRGQTLSIYMVVTMGGITIGQFFLNVADPASFELFVIASVLVSLSLVPMALSETSAPSIVEGSPLPLRELLDVVPTGAIVMVLSGAAAATLFAMGPVYGASIGMSNAQISLFISASVIGATIFQMPIGSLSDKLPRRSVMITVAAIASAASLYGTTTGSGFPATLAMFFLGAASFPLYSLAIAYTNDWIADDQRIGASSLLVMINGVGAILGPLVASLAMRTFDPIAYFWVLLVIHGIIVAYLAYRIALREGIPVADQSEYQNVPARSSSVIAALGRKIPRPPPVGRRRRISR